MAKYSVEHSCGHTLIHHLIGKNSERERKISWMENNLCKDCFIAQQEELKQKQKTDAAQEAENFATEAGLVLLVGTEKQIAWANTVRMHFILAFNRFVERANKTNNTKLIDFSKSTALWLSSIKDAKWWIDNRHPSESGDILRHITIRSPYLTLEVAKDLGIEAQYAAFLAGLKEQEHIAEKEAHKRFFKEEFSKLGITGKIHLWHNERGYVRIYADDFTYYHTGPMPKKLEKNKEITGEEDLLKICSSICSSYKIFTIYI